MNKKDTYKWDFEVQTNHHIEAIRPDLIIIEKVRNKCQIVNFPQYLVLGELQ